MTQPKEPKQPRQPGRSKAPAESKPAEPAAGAAAGRRGATSPGRGEVEAGVRAARSSRAGAVRAAGTAQAGAANAAADAANAARVARIFYEPPARATLPPVMPAIPSPPPVALTIDGQAVDVPAGATLLEACRGLGIEVPTLCWAENLTPVNVCRLCVVEVTGARVLAPACSRRVEPGMEVQTDSPRVRTARKVVLELLGSAVDLSLAGATAPDGSLAAVMARYGADPTRFGPPAAATAAGERDARAPGHHHAPEGSVAETVAQPVTLDNDLYVRDYSRCILCYKCVEACGTDAQNTFAIAVAGRGFDAHISTEYATSLAASACVFCGNCIGVCPTGALMFTSEFEMRAAGTWDEAGQTWTDTICPYCGVGCTLTLHVQDNTIVRVTSPADSSVTAGHLCVKGRFGYGFVQARAEDGRGG